MSGSSATSTLDIVLKDDVSPAAKAIAASLQKVEAEAKELDGALAKSGTSSKFQAKLKSIGVSKDQIEGTAKAFKDYAKAQDLALDKRGDWTKAQRDGVANWEGIIARKLQADRGLERAQEYAAVARAKKDEDRAQKEAANRVAEAAKAAETEAKERRVAAERLAAEERRQQQKETNYQRQQADQAARDARNHALQEERDEQSRVERRMRDDARIAEHAVREQRRAAEAQYRHDEVLAHQREHFAERQGFRHFALQSAAMAVSAHAMVHVGEQAWEQGAELQHERIGLQNAGRTPEEIREIERAARGVQASTPTSGFIESLKTVAETTAAFGSVEHAVKNLPFISKMTSILKTAGGDNIHGDAAQLGQAFAKTFEERQTKPEEFEAEAKQMIPAMVATGGTFNPEQLYAFAQQAKSALPSLSMRFLSKIAPSLIGAQGGERAGTGLKAFEDVIAGKVNDKKQAEEFLHLGLLDPKMAIMKAGHAVGWKSGAVKDTFLAMTDPLAWSEQYLIPALKKQGVDTGNREATQMILNTMFRNQNANMFATEIAQEASRHRLHKDEELYGKVGSFDEIYARNLQDFGVAAGALKSALGNLAGAVSVPLMGKVSAGLIVLADGINHLANMALEHPATAATAGIVAAGASLAAAAKIGYGLYNGFGLGASASALTGAAGSLEAAAAHLGGGVGGKLPGGAIVPAGGSVAGAVVAPAAVELSAAIVAGGIAVGTVGLVKAAFEAQQPGNGGQWSRATLATRAEDQLRLEAQQQEADRLRSEIDRNKRREKIPGTSDALNIPLQQQLAEKLNQIESLRRSLVDIDAAGSHEARVGRAMMAMARPEEFGPNLPPDLAGQLNYIDREAERGRAYAALPRPEEFGPTREEAGPVLPGDVAQRLRFVEQELERSRAVAAPLQPEEFGPPMPRDRPWVGEAPAASAAQPPAPNVTPQVDTSPAEQGLMQLMSLSTEAGEHMTGALNVSASPTIDTGSISAAQAAAEQLLATLARIGAAASAASSAVASAAAAGGANAAIGARRSMNRTPTGAVTA